MYARPFAALIVTECHAAQSIRYKRSHQLEPHVHKALCDNFSAYMVSAHQYDMTAGCSTWSHTLRILLLLVLNKRARATALTVCSVL